MTTSEAVENRELRKRVKTLVGELAADGIPVAVTCRVLKFAKQPYYRWLAAPVSQRDRYDAQIANLAFDTHQDDPRLGYRFIAGEINDAGLVASERRVWRVCSEVGLMSQIVTQRRGSGKVPHPAVHDDRVRRDFTADSPDRLSLTDIAEHPTGEGKLYLRAIKDVWSNRIVGHWMGSRMTSGLPVAALRTAIQQRRQHHLGKLMPIEFKTIMTTRAASAAPHEKSSAAWAPSEDRAPGGQRE